MHDDATLFNGFIRYMLIPPLRNMTAITKKQPRIRGQCVGKYKLE